MAIIMTLEDLRKKVLFHNSVDVWIAASEERGVQWSDTAAYKRFIAYLLEQDLNLKAFNLCAHEAGAVDDQKTAFTDALAQSKDADPNSRNYTVRLSDSTISAIRKYQF